MILSNLSFIIPLYHNSPFMGYDGNIKFIFSMEISWEHGISLATSKLRICKGIRDDLKRDYDKRIG
jgi:hypothetical protein